MPVGTENLDDHLTTVAPIDDEVSRWGGRDQPSTPDSYDDDDDDDDYFDPSPDQESTGGGSLTCIEFDPDTRDCLRYESFQASNTAFDDMPPDVDGFTWPDDDDDFLEDPDADDEVPDQWRYVVCGKSHPPFADELEYNAGLAVGFIGSLGYNPDHWPRVPDDTSTDDCEDVNSPAACVGKSLCEPGTIARGMEYRRNEAGFITGLNLDCFQGPS